MSRHSQTPDSGQGAGRVRRGQAARAARYIRGWQWTGFQANEQLWDWLKLLLLPLIIPTVLLPAVKSRISRGATGRTK